MTMPALLNGRLMVTAWPATPPRVIVPAAMLVTSESAPAHEKKLCPLALAANVPALLSLEASPRQGSPLSHVVEPSSVTVLPPRIWGEPLIRSAAGPFNVVVVAPVSVPPVHSQSVVTLKGPLVDPPTMSRFGIA